MKKIILMVIFILMILNPATIKESIFTSCALWYNTFLVVLFPFFIINDLLITYGVAETLNNIFYKFLAKLFRVSKNTSYIIILSLLSGNSTSARLINQLLSKDSISKKEASYLLTFTCYANPVFIYSILGVYFFQNYTIGIIFLIAHYLSNFIIGIALRPKTNYLSKGTINTDLSFTKSIEKNTKLIIIILGYIIVLNLFKDLLLTFDFFKASYFKFLFYNFEFVSGVKEVASSGLSLKLKVAIASFLIGFGGLSVHVQIYSFIKEKLKYSSYLIARIFQGILSFLIVFIIFNFIYKETVDTLVYQNQFVMAIIVVSLVSISIRFLFTIK